MRQPPILNDGTNKVWLLKKPLYGLKQAPRQWNHKLQSALQQLGFTQAQHDPALFVNADIKALIFVWVDDLIIAADSTRTEQLVSTILERFEGRDLGEASWILGLEVKRDRENRTITITQRRMIQDVLERFGFDQCRPVSTPLDPGQPVDIHPHTKAIEKLNAKLNMPDLPLDERELIDSKVSALLQQGDPLGTDEITRYMQIIGAVQYLATVSRPDIANATGRLARFMSKPSSYLMKCAERLLRYLKGTIDYGLVLDGSRDSSLPTFIGYADSDYVQNNHSTSGLVFCVYGQPVHWRSKRQNVIAGSSTEAELMAMNLGALTLKWVKMLSMSDFGIKNNDTVLYGDNQSTVSICKDPQSSDRTRHIDGKFKKIQELIKNEVLRIKWIPTYEQLADCLTKQLPKPAFEQARADLGILKLKN